MKKIMMCFAGAALMISLAACTPTTQKQSTAETMNMEGVETQPAGGAWDKVPDPTAESVAVISVYSEKEGVAGLEVSMSEVKELSAQALVDKLIEEGVLEQGTQVLSFETEGGEAAEKTGPGVETTASSEAGEKTGILDLSQLPEGDKSELLIGALGNTFIENFELEKLELSVNGENKRVVEFYTAGKK